MKKYAIKERKVVAAERTSKKYKQIKTTQTFSAMTSYMTSIEKTTKMNTSPSKSSKRSLRK